MRNASGAKVTAGKGRKSATFPFWESEESAHF